MITIKENDLMERHAIFAVRRATDRLSTNDKCDKNLFVQPRTYEEMLARQIVRDKEALAERQYLNERYQN